MAGTAPATGPGRRHRARELAVDRRRCGVPVVDLHGLGGSHRYFQALRAELPAHQVIGPDLLGFGRSPKPRRCAYRVADHLAALEPLVPPGALLVGYSAGAILAVALASRAEVPLRGLVLLGLPAYASAGAAASLAGIGPLARATAEGRLRAHAACAMVCMTRPLARRLAPHLAAGLPAAVAADSVAHTWRSYSRTLRTVVVGHRVAGDVAAVRVPVLMVHGAGDCTAPLPADAGAHRLRLPGEAGGARRRPSPRRSPAPAARRGWWCSTATITSPYTAPIWSPRR